MNIEQIKEWKIYRAIYDYDGLNCIEGDERFEEKIKNEYGELGYIIGQAYQLNDHIHIEPRLEGEKEILEYVLKKIQETET